MSSNAPQPYVALPGSERQPVLGAQESGALDPSEPVEVSIYLRPKSAMPQPTGADTPITHDRYVASYGADQADVDKIVAFAHMHGLTVVQTDLARRAVVLSGTVATVTAAFQLQLRRYTSQGKFFRGRAGAIHVPQDIAPLIEAILGLDNREQARSHMRISQTSDGAMHAQTATASGFTSAELAQLYHYRILNLQQEPLVRVIVPTSAAMIFGSWLGRPRRSTHDCRKSKPIPKRATP